MTCVACKRDARDNAVAYYTVEVLAFVRDDRSQKIISPHSPKLLNVIKCWNCLTPAEQTERMEKVPNELKLNTKG